MNPKGPPTDEQRVAVALGDCYRLLNYEVRRLNRKKDAPTAADLQRLNDLRERIATLKRGELPPAGWSS